MEIIEQKDNLLLDRKEVKIIVEAEKNPSYDEAMDAVSEEFKADKENIAIKEIKGKFGRKTFLVSAFIYKTKEGKDKYEGKKEEKKDGGEVPAQPAAAPATEQTAPVEEKPKEEKK